MDFTPTAIATVVTVGSGPMRVADNSGHRHELMLFNRGPATVEIALAATAVASAGFTLASGAMYVESQYAGPVSAIVPGGATTSLFRVDKG